MPLKLARLGVREGASRDAQACSFSYCMNEIEVFAECGGVLNVSFALDINPTGSNSWTVVHKRLESRGFMIFIMHVSDHTGGWCRLCCEKHDWIRAFWFGTLSLCHCTILQAWMMPDGTAMWDQEAGGLCSRLLFKFAAPSTDKIQSWSRVSPSPRFVSRVSSCLVSLVSTCPCHACHRVGFKFRSYEHVLKSCATENSRFEPSQQRKITGVARERQISRSVFLTRSDRRTFASVVVDPRPKADSECCITKNWSLLVWPGARWVGLGRILG